MSPILMPRINLKSFNLLLVPNSFLMSITFLLTSLL